MSAGDIRDIVSGEELVSIVCRRQIIFPNVGEKMKIISSMSIIYISVLVVILSWQVNAETLEEIRRIEESKRLALRQTEVKILEGERRLLIDYGGWIDWRYDDYSDDDNDSTTQDSLEHTFSTDFRFWLKATLRPPADALYKNEHSIYIRLKDLHIEREPDLVNSDDDHDGPHIDYAYVVLDLSPLGIEMGRRYFSIGQGISYSNLNDGVEFYISLKDWSFKGMVSKTLPHEDNIDTSVPGWDLGSERFYYGIETTYIGIPDHSIYGYVLIQRDESEEIPNDPVYDYTYDSEYFGIGFQGKFLPNLHYWTEVIRETGKSRVYITNYNKRNIDAWAGDFGISYNLDIYSHPNLSFEYAFGTGDADRVSVTDTLNGNTSGADRNFNYFGYLPAGYALSPRLSNLHFFKLGVLFKPLEGWYSFRNFNMGVDFYLYYKQKRDGGIYDTDAVLKHREIGNEVDINISWSILSDLSLGIQYGYFHPGDAYPDWADDSETYFSTNMTFTF